MELDILYEIQKFHNPILDPIMIGFSYIGEFGTIWIIIAIVFILTKKYRLCGITMLVAMILSALAGNFVLKNIIARSRPSWIDHSIILLIENPVDYSFPSGHTMNSFTSAMTVFMYHKKPGILAFTLASFIAFSRLYLFVHYPSDVFAGIALGVAISIFTVLVVNNSKLKSKFDFIE